MDTPDILDAAADHIESVGLWQGQPDRTPGFSAQRSTCAALAIRIVAGETNDAEVVLARRALCQFLGLEVPPHASPPHASPLAAIAAWNDAQPDAFQVTNALRKAAEALR